MHHTLTLARNVNWFRFIYCYTLIPKGFGTLSPNKAKPHCLKTTFVRRVVDRGPRGA